MRRKSRKILLSICAVFIFLFLSVFMTACSRNVNLESFSASDKYFLVEKDVAITFTVEANGVKSVDLCSSDGDVVEQMYDNGKNGDEKAHDGVYSCVVEENAKKSTSMEYYAKYKELTSEKILIAFFATPGQEAQQEYLNVQQEIGVIDEKYFNEKGFVSASDVPKAVEEVSKYAEKLLKDGAIVEYEKTENSVVMKLSNGLTTVYTPATEGTYSIGQNTPMSISLYQPDYTWVSTLDLKYIDLPSGISREVDLITAAGNSIQSTFNNYTLAQESIYWDQAVTLESVKQIGANQIVLWQGHGTYAGGDLHSIVMTGEAFDWEAYYSGGQYYEDCVQDRIVDCDGRASISYKFINTYCKSMDNTFVYLGPCQSGYDDVLANAFLNKGAEAVVANTDTILCLYGDMMEYTTTYLMTQINQDTKDYYTLGEALQEAKDLYGESDAKWRKMFDDTYQGKGAIPTIFGGKKAENFRLRAYESVYVHDFAIPDSQTLTIGEINVIEPTITPENADSYDIEWKSSDESVVTVTGTGDGGIVHGKAKGTATVTATITSGKLKIEKQTNIRVASQGRDTILVLDISGSMSGRPMKEMKEAAIDFCKELLKDTYSNRVGIVFYDSEVIRVDLTNDLNTLVQYIENTHEGGSTNMEGAIYTAKCMMDEQGQEGSIKNIVVMADGLPNVGKTSSTGPMQSNSLFLYSNEEYANAVIQTAQDAMQYYNMYSLGFFHDLSGSQLSFATELMQYLTNQTDGYHQVEEASQLQFAFGDISEEISDGSKIVINIACPVDVSVTYGDETLSSSAENYNGETSFGNLQLLGKDQDIKVLCLKPDIEYEIQINGTGTGEMHYSVNYLDEEENVTDSRSFPEIPITPTTKITSTTVSGSKDMELKLDRDGDGKIDTIWTAVCNGMGKISFGSEPKTKKQTSKSEDKKASIKFEFPKLEGDQTVVAIAGVLGAAILIGSFALIVVGASSQRSNDEDEDEIDISYVKPKEKEEKDSPSISILSGPLAGTKIPLHNKETVYLGKDPRHSNIVFADGYSHVSRIHCSVYYDDKYEKYFVTDSSSNGVYYTNMDKLEKGKRVAIERGTTLLLANRNAEIRLN